MPARVSSIQVCPGHREPMRPLSSARLETGTGLDGDKHANPASRRQVLIVDKEALDQLELEAGVIKENITVEGLDVMNLNPGTQLKLGAEALVELTSVCEPCFRMDEIRPGLKAALEGKRGMNSRVINGGQIAVGDPITIVQPQELAS
ncbi:MAG TPA: MOSC domain-containing protein [Candidatus Dormibacteraeota bacterium]|nr:MOSC domain-containing protein [Candidatus Dormibacteraeota bacterium]